MKFHVVLLVTVVSCSVELPVVEGMSCHSEEHCPGKLVCENEVCVDPQGIVSVVTEPSVCGDSKVNGEEVCDDGGTEDETECPYGSGTCFSCTSDCLSEIQLTGPHCGDGVIGHGEGCDDGNSVTETSCDYGDVWCAPCDAGCVSLLANLPLRYCGDGLTTHDETCDDGDVIDSGNGCGADCQSYSTCGDGIFHSGVEECDGGVGCTDCILDPGWTCQSKLLVEDPYECSLVRTDCSTLPDFTLCDIDTSASDGYDRSYDICISGSCISPGCNLGGCNVPGPNFELGDTNQRLCYDDVDEINCPNSSQSYYGQDAQYGWDILNPDTSVRFTQVEPAVNEPVILDDITELEWQACPIGWSGSQCDIGENVMYDWNDAFVACDDLVWAGEHDWRLPSISELSAIADYGAPSLRFLDSFYIIRSSQSSTEYAPDDTASWTVGNWIAYSIKTVARFAMCVRGGSPLVGDKFVRTEQVVGEPIVEDSATSVQWQGDHSSVQMNWEAALSYCEDSSWGGFTDWRLPNAKYLASIVDYREFLPAIDVFAFPGTPSDDFWSSTTRTDSPSEAWIVQFGGSATANNGKVREHGKLYLHHVRCVRGFP